MLKWLRECEVCTGWSLHADFRDTYFQRDPFADLRAGRGEDVRAAPPGATAAERPDLLLYEEWVNRADVWYRFDFAKKCYPSNAAQTLGRTLPMLCSGTTVGTRAGMIRYLEVLVDEFRANLRKGEHCRPPVLTDQALHNWLLYTGKFGPRTAAVPWATGAVNTIGALASMVFAMKACQSGPCKAADVPEEVASLLRDGIGFTSRDSPGWPTRWLDERYHLTDDRGLLLQVGESGKPVAPVVHQYDRFGVKGGFFPWLGKFVQNGGKAH